MSAPRRVPFDAVDAARAAAYLETHGLAIVDPFTGAHAYEDRIYTTSLAGCRFLLEHTFGAARADGRTFRIYPFFVGKASANAFAIEHAGLQLCGLDVGLGAAAYEMSLFVFAQASLFKQVGDPGGERSPQLLAGSQLAFWMTDRIREHGTSDDAPVGRELIPRDRQRQFGAHVLTQQLLRFVWLHESFHGLNGHTGLLARQRPGAVLNEMPDETTLGLIEIESKKDAEAYKRLRHAMEYEADRAALWMLVHLQQIDLEPAPGLLAWPKLLRLKVAIFAAVMMTFLFDQSARRMAQRSGVTHPAAQNRLVNLIRTLASRFGDVSGEVAQAFAAVLAEMKALEACLPEFVSASRVFDYVHSAYIQQELEEIDDGVTLARRQFAPFAYRTPIEDPPD